MNVFTVTVTVIIMVLSTVYVSVRHFTSREKPDSRKYAAPILMSLSTLLVVTDILAGEGVVVRFPSDLIFSLSALLVINSTLIEWNGAVWSIISIAIIQIVLMSYYIMVFIGIMPAMPEAWSVSIAGMAVILISIIFICAIHLRVREVRLVIKHGNVWSCLCIMVDMIYLLFIFIYGCVWVLCVFWDYSSIHSVSHAVTLLLVLEYGALSIRLADDALFVIRSRHERRIVESMKISNIEVSPDTAKIQQMYRNIYERVVQLFENENMYLNSELTINDIVKIVYTNKLYISRAISQFTGRNFCQFVNYYRVTHSIKLFRENPDLKVSELANQSGFNSSVTYSMAFRLYMSETPSDWCRKEKYKIAKKKK